jgi:glycosyltransferase involved in cell wall biosynthesis
MEKTGKSFFTIITSTLNVIDTIERCVKSVAEQTFRDYEHIIVDGASTDGTVEFLNSRKDLFSVCISEPDTGIYNAWNKALKYAQGEWILFLGADDILADENVLADVAGFIKENNAESGIVYGDMMFVSKDTHEDRAKIHLPLEKLCSKSMLELRPKLPPHPAVFHHKAILSRSAGFDETYRISADLKPVISAICQRKESVYYISRLINRMSMGGISSLIGMRSFFEDVRVLHDLGIPISKIAFIWTFSKNAFKVSVKKVLGDRMAYRIIDMIRKLRGKPSLWI